VSGQPKIRCSIRTYLIYLKKLFGYLLLKAHGMSGAIVPTRKQNTRGLINVDEIAGLARTTITLLVGLTLRELKGRTDNTCPECIRLS